MNKRTVFHLKWHSANNQRYTLDKPKLNTVSTCEYFHLQAFRSPACCCLTEIINSPPALNQLVKSLKLSRWKAEIQFETRDCNSFLEVIVFVNSFNQILRIYWNIHQWCIKFSLNPGYAHVDLCSHTINNFFLRQTNFRLLSPEKINFIIFFPYVNLWFIIFHLLSFFFFFADWQVNNSDFSTIQVKYTIHTEV